MRAEVDRAVTLCRQRPAMRPYYAARLRNDWISVQRETRVASAAFVHRRRNGMFPSPHVDVPQFSRVVRLGRLTVPLAGLPAAARRGVAFVSLGERIDVTTPVEKHKMHIPGPSQRSSVLGWLNGSGPDRLVSTADRFGRSLHGEGSRRPAPQLQVPAVASPRNQLFNSRLTVRSGGGYRGSDQ
jgi:hypothetical protein